MLGVIEISYALSFCLLLILSKCPSFWCKQLTVMINSCAKLYGWWVQNGSSGTI